MQTFGEVAAWGVAGQMQSVSRFFDYYSFKAVQEKLRGLGLLSLENKEWL